MIKLKHIPWGHAVYKDGKKIGELFPLTKYGTMTVRAGYSLECADGTKRAFSRSCRLKDIVRYLNRDHL